jgi:hypothetical protein
MTGCPNVGCNYTYNDFTIPSEYTPIGIVGIKTGNDGIRYYDFGVDSLTLIHMYNTYSTDVIVTPSIRILCYKN